MTEAIDETERLKSLVSELVGALEGLEGRVEEASKWMHNSQDWQYDEGWVAGKTLWEWVFEDARTIIAKVRRGE